MSFRKKTSGVVAATAIAVGGLFLAAPQPAFAAHTCTIGNSAQGAAEAFCADTSPGGDKYRVRWGCFNNFTGAFRVQLGNTASVALGNKSKIPNCNWYERAHGSLWVETLWS